MERANFSNMTLDDIIRTVYADKVLREMLSEPSSAWDGFHARLELLGNHLDAHANVIAIAQFGKTPSPEEDMPEEELRQRWRHLMETVVGQAGTVFSIGGNRFGMLVAQMERSVLESWRKRLTVESMVPVCIGVGPPANKPAELSRSMSGAKRAIQMRFYLGDGVIHAEDLPAPQESFENPFPLTESLFEQYLHCTYIEEVRVHISTFFRYLLEKGPVPAQNIHDISIRFLLGFERYMEQVSDGQVSFEYCNLMQLVAQDTLDSLQEQLSQRIHELLATVRTHLSGNGRDVVSRMLQEMEKDCKKVSLHGLSQQLFLSPAYMSLLFKSATGKTFTDRLTDIRIQKAKQLLIHSEYKAYEIAEQVGYQDARYFSQIFRKKVGVLPSEYRDWLLKPVFRDVNAPREEDPDPLSRWNGSLLPTMDGSPSVRLRTGGRIKREE